MDHRSDAQVETDYEADFHAWTVAQAAALRAAGQRGANVAVDWEHVAEEIESLGRSDAREVRSRLRQILVHLLKLACSGAEGPRAGWRREVMELRAGAEAVLEDSPSLRRRVPAFIAGEWVRAVGLARASLAEFGEEMGEVEGFGWGEAEVLGDWWPEGVG